MTDSSIPSQLPLKRNIMAARNLSLIVAALMGAMSLAGLVFPDRIYPSEALIQSFMANDLVNLVIGLPILLGSMWLVRRGELTGLLFWPGALLFTLYNYTAYLFGIPLDLTTVVYLTIVLLSAYTTFDLLKNIDGKSVQAQLSGRVPDKIAGWILVVFGILFLLRAISMLTETGTDQATPPISEIGTLIADLVVSTLWIAGGAMLLRRMPLGYVCGLGLLFAASMLFIGLIIFLLLQPVLTDAQFALVDVIVVSIMGLICFIPFGLFVRGVISIRQSE